MASMTEESRSLIKELSEEDWKEFSVELEHRIRNLVNTEVQIKFNINGTR